MARKVSLKCAIAGCHYQRKMTLAEHEELRRVGREKNATAGLVCPAHVKAAFNFEFDDIDIDFPLEELLVEETGSFIGTVAVGLLRHVAVLITAASSYEQQSFETKIQTDQRSQLPSHF